MNVDCSVLSGKEYYVIKVLELLLYLDALSISDSVEERPYFYKSQIEKIKAARDLITEDLRRHYTTEKLAKRVSDRMRIRQYPKRCGSSPIPPACRSWRGSASMRKY